MSFVPSHFSAASYYIYISYIVIVIVIVILPFNALQMNTRQMLYPARFPNVGECSAGAMANPGGPSASWLETRNSDANSRAFGRIPLFKVEVLIHVYIIYIYIYMFIFIVVVHYIYIHICTHCEESFQMGFTGYVPGPFHFRLSEESEARIFYGGPKSYSYPLHRDLPDGSLTRIFLVSEASRMLSWKQAAT